jgi:hypothetical protein
MTRQVVLFTMLGLLAGCGDSHQLPYQRFVPFNGTANEVPPTGTTRPSVPWNAALALDTKTGSVCVTYEFKVDLDYPQWKELPTCKSLFDKYSE